MAEHDEFPTNQKDDFFDILGNEFRLIGKSWNALKRNLATFILIYILPYFLLSFLVFAYVGTIFTVQNDKVTVNDFNAPLAIIASLGVIILITLLAIATIIAQLTSVRGHKISFGEVIEKAWPFFWRFIGLGILSVLVVLVGLVLLIIPGLLAIFFLSLAGYAMIDKNLGVTDSMRTSYELVKRNWKIVLAYMILTFLLSLPQIVPIFGAIVTVALSIAYFCLPAILYTRITRDTKLS